MKTNGDSPVSAGFVKVNVLGKIVPSTDEDAEEYKTYGMTKREAFAMAAMSGYMAYQYTGHQDPHGISEYAVNCADALINALNKEVAP